MPISLEKRVSNKEKVLAARNKSKPIHDPKCQWRYHNIGCYGFDVFIFTRCEGKQHPVNNDLDFIYCPYCGKLIQFI